MSRRNSCGLFLAEISRQTSSCHSHVRFLAKEQAKGNKMFAKGIACRRWVSLKARPKARFEKPDPEPVKLYPKHRIIDDTRVPYSYEDDYVETAEYPEIDETHQCNGTRKKRLDDMLQWYKKIRDAPNPEAKTAEINKPRYYGWRTIMLNEKRFEYDSDSFYKFITRTEVVENTLPQLYSSAELEKEAKYYADKLQVPLMDAINYELNEQMIQNHDDLAKTMMRQDLDQSQSLVRQINRFILAFLGSQVEHLNTCQVDVDPKIEAFWFAGGLQPSRSLKRSRRKILKYVPNIHFKEDDPMECCFQYIGSPILQIRCDNPISNFVDPDSPLCLRGPQESPSIFPYSMQSYGISERQFRYASLIQGAWTGDSNKCSHIAFHPRSHLLDDAVQESEHWKSDFENAITSQIVLSTFGRLLSQAFNFGFDQFSELNYPFSSQTIVTDGLKWSFATYQLNTIHLSDIYLEKNKKQNICWKTSTMSILDESNPQSLKLNLDTLTTLLKFYLNKPTPINVENPTPYITAPLQTWDNEIKREITFFNYRDMVSQRWYVMENLIRHQYPEIYEWEYIYKIRHNQRYQERRRRFFEVPHDFPTAKPYDVPYRMINPRFVWKRMKFLMEEVAAKKELQRIEAAKLAESAKYGVVLPKKSKN